jgi:hypothetical protein
MNTVEINKIAPRVEDIEPMGFEGATLQSLTAREQAVRKSRRVAGVRYVLLALVVLLLGALGLYVQNSIKEMNSDLENIHANLATGSSLGPD